MLISAPIISPHIRGLAISPNRVIKAYFIAFFVEKLIFALSVSQLDSTEQQQFTGSSLGALAVKS